MRCEIMTILKKKDIPGTVIVIKGLTPAAIKLFAEELKKCTANYCITNYDMEIHTLDEKTGEYVKITNKKPKVNTNKVKQILKKITTKL